MFAIIIQYFLKEKKIPFFCGYSELFCFIFVIENWTNWKRRRVFERLIIQPNSFLGKGKIVFLWNNSHLIYLLELLMTCGLRRISGTELLYVGFLRALEVFVPLVVKEMPVSFSWKCISFSPPLLSLPSLLEWVTSLFLISHSLQCPTHGSCLSSMLPSAVSGHWVLCPLPPGNPSFLDLVTSCLS